MNWQTPWYFEGWDNIELIGDDTFSTYYWNEIYKYKNFKQHNYNKACAAPGMKACILSDIFNSQLFKIFIAKNRLMLGSMILEAYVDSHFLDNYDIYDCLLNYWNEKLQDDVYAIRAFGYAAARDVEFVYQQKKNQ